MEISDSGYSIHLSKTPKKLKYGVAKTFDLNERLLIKKSIVNFNKLLAASNKPEEIKEATLDLLLNIFNEDYQDLKRRKNVFKE